MKDTMAVIRLPRQYKALSGLVLASIPVFVLNLWVMQKGINFKTLGKDKLIWIAVEAVWALLTFYWLSRAKWTGFWSVVTLALVLLSGNIYFLITTKNYALAFYALFLVILSGLYALHLYRSLQETYYHPGTRWFEGRPPFIPRLEAELKAGGKNIPVRLSRLGTDGCYAFTRDGEVFPAEFNRSEAIAFKLGDLGLDCAVELISQTKDKSGQGLKFIVSSADQMKDIKDFIERIRSSGYVD